MENLDELERLIRYEFTDKNLLLTALMHSSYGNELKDKGINKEAISNERLEFLGDAILSVVIAEVIYFKFKDLSEGEMTKLRASIVCESSLAECAKKLNLGKHILLSKGQRSTGGVTRSSTLSDAFEAIIAAVYLDGGIKPASEFIKRQLGKIIEDSVNGLIGIDYKTKLQEKMVKHNHQKVIYEIVSESGPPHNKSFVAVAKLNEKAIGQGTGKSKKEAEQYAARMALEG